MASTAAAQQGGWLIESSNVVSPSQPTTTVEVWAWFDDDPKRDLAFVSGDFEFHAEDGVFSNPQVFLAWTGGAPSPGGTPGTVRGNTVSGVFVVQLWGFAGLWPDPSNPILVWSADWTTTDFTPRSVNLNTRSTTDFQIGLIANGLPIQLYPQGFIPGTGVIEVVPSPASAVPMVVVGAMMLRRRRRN